MVKSYNPFEECKQYMDSQISNALIVLRDRLENLFRIQVRLWLSSESVHYSFVALISMFCCIIRSKANVFIVHTYIILCILHILINPRLVYTNRVTQCSKQRPRHKIIVLRYPKSPKHYANPHKAEIYSAKVMV